MQIADFTTYRSAHLLIRAHGEDAATQAEQVANALLAAGDIEGQRIWRDICAIIDRLQIAEQPDAAVIH